MKKLCFLVILSFLPILAISKRPFVVYYQSWSGKANGTDIRHLPSYVTHLNFAFIKPDITYTKGSLSLKNTGLETHFSGAHLKQLLKEVKKQNPELNLLVAIGGATYTNWKSLSTDSIKDFVRDFGFDGIDVDYEATPPDARILNQSISSLAKTLDKEMISLALMHVSAFGKDEWLTALPYPNKWHGFIHKLGAPLLNVDMINIMAYEAGASFDKAQAYLAFKHYYKGIVTVGMEVPPEGHGKGVWTVQNIKDISKLIQSQSSQDGMMLWSLHKKAKAPFASRHVLAETACIAFNLASSKACSMPLN